MRHHAGLDSVIGLVGIITFILALILFMDLVSEAFKRDKGPRSLITGLQALLFPLGTYYYCKSQWEIYGTRFKLITILASIGFASMAISKVW